MIDLAICSTDHKDIANEAIKHGLEVPFVRPKNLSGDTISDIDVLKHALNFCENKYETIYDIILMLQPTSPFRTSKHLNDAIKIFIDKNADSVWSVSKTDSKAHPDKQLKISNGSLNFYNNNGDKIVYRQQLSDLYHRNGVVYVISRNTILKHNSIRGNKSYPYVINEFMPNIDTEFDLLFANLLLK